MDHANTMSAGAYSLRSPISSHSAVCPGLSTTRSLASSPTTPSTSALCSSLIQSFSDVLKPALCAKFPWVCTKLCLCHKHLCLHGKLLFILSKSAQGFLPLQASLKFLNSTEHALITEACIWNLLHSVVIFFLLTLCSLNCEHLKTWDYIICISASPVPNPAHCA